MTKKDLQSNFETWLGISWNFLLAFIILATEYVRQ